MQKPLYSATQLAKLARPLAALLSVLISGFVFVSINNSADTYYLQHHPLPPGEDDLGFGMFVMFWLLIATLISLPLAVWLYLWLSRRILRYLGRLK